MSQQTTDETAREIARKALARAQEALTRHGAHESTCAERWGEIKGGLNEIWNAVDALRAAIAQLNKEDRSEAVANREARIRLLYWVAGGAGGVILLLLSALLKMSLG